MSVTSPRCIALLHMQAEHCRLVHPAVDNGGEEAKEEEEDQEGGGGGEEIGVNSLVPNPLSLRLRSEGVWYSMLLFLLTIAAMSQSVDSPLSAYCSTDLRRTRISQVEEEKENA